MPYINDNYDYFLEHENRIPENLPICSHCQDSIYSHYLWNINGKLYCEYCMDSFKEPNEAIEMV